MDNCNIEYAAGLSMRPERETIGRPKDEYLKKAKKLSKLASTNLVLRVGRHHFDELISTGISERDALTLLLEREDASLNEWREAMVQIRADADGTS